MRTLGRIVESREGYIERKRGQGRKGLDGCCRKRAPGKREMERERRDKRRPRCGVSGDERREERDG